MRAQERAAVRPFDAAPRQLDRARARRLRQLRPLLRLAHLRHLLRRLHRRALGLEVGDLVFGGRIRVTFVQFLYFLTYYKCAQN